MLRSDVCPSVHYKTVFCKDGRIAITQLQYYIVSQTMSNVTTWSRCNFDIPVHESILIIFGRNVTEKVSNKKTPYFPT